MKETNGIYILGTDTDVGKTVVSAGIMHMLLSKGFKACYYKPVSSGGFENNEGLVSYDVSFVNAVSGFCKHNKRINPFRYKIPASPHLAAKIEGNPVDEEIILDTYKELSNEYDIMIVEGCGGLAVPLREDGYMQYQLIKKLNLGCVLVTRTTLGTINHTLLTLSLADKLGIPVYGLIFNGFTGNSIENDNILTIKKLSGLPVLSVIPNIKGIDIETMSFCRLKNVIEENLFIEELIKIFDFKESIDV